MGGSQPNPTPTPFGELLRRWRREAGWSQGVLAERAGLSRNGVNSLERGVVRKVRRETVQLLADALQLEPQARAAFEAAARTSAFAASLPPSRVVPLPAVAHSARFIGRQPELARIERHLAATDHAAAVLFFFAGEPGIGKSRLLHEASSRAAAVGWRVLAGECTRRSGQEPYAPFADMLARSIVPLSLAEQRRALQGCTWLVRLLPELMETAVVPAPTWSLPPEQERRLMFAAVARYLANVAGPAGTLLLLDDLQWAGADALDLLESIARAASEAATQDPAPGSRLRILAAYRSTEVNVEHPIATVQADLARTGLAGRHALGPLSSVEASSLAQDLLAGVEVDEVEREVLVERLTNRAGGVPFYLVNCSQAVRVGALEDESTQDGTKQRRASDGTAVEEAPWAVAEVIRQRVAALPKSARDLLAVAAVIGRVVPHSLLEAVMAASEPISDSGFLPALDEALRARLLVEREEEQPVSGRSGEYQFAHDLIREVILQDLSAARRVQLHRVVATALEQLAEAKGTREKVAAELADHFLHAEEPARALPYVLLAGDQAEAAYAHAEAEGHYRLAIELAQEVGDQAREAGALEKLGVILYISSHYDEAFELFDCSSRLYRSSADVEGEGRIAVQMSLLCVRWDRAEEGLRRLLPFLDSDRASALPLSTTVQLFSMKSLLLEAPDQLEESLRAAEHADTLAQSITDSSVQAQAAFQRGQALEALGRSDEALACLGRAIALSEIAKSLFDLQVLVRAYNFCGYVQSQRGDWSESALCYEAAKAYAYQLGDPLLSALITVDQGILAFRLGNWSLAHASFEQARQIYLTVGRSAAAKYAPRLAWLTGLLCFAEGRQEEADRCFDELMALVSAGPAAAATTFMPRVTWARALRHLLDGQPELACAQLEPFRDLPGLEHGDVIGAILEIPVLLVWAFLQLGRESDARMELTRSEARAASSHERMEVSRIRAMIAMWQGSWQEAEISLEESLSFARSMPYPYEEAKALYVCGQMYAAKGEPDSAREKYRAALAICERLGEGLYRPHIERALAGLSE